MKLGSLCAGIALVLVAGIALADNSSESAESKEVNCPKEPCTGQYEEYRCCGECYQETCFSGDLEIKCKKECTEGCFCLEGFVRQYEGGKCLPKKLCYYYWSRGFNSR